MSWSDCMSLVNIKSAMTEGQKCIFVQPDSKSSLGAFWIHDDAEFLRVDNEDADQTAQMRRLT